MGDPKRCRKKYDTPGHLWKIERLYEDKKLYHKYGLKNMREVWIAKTILRRIRHNARNIIARKAKNDPTASKDEKKLLNRLIRMGILNEGATIEDVLSLTVEAILERRLQTLVLRKGLARTIRQARQLIVHGHIAINGRRVTRPGYLVSREEEQYIDYAPNSPFAQQDHPERLRIIGAEVPTEEQTQEISPETSANIEQQEVKE